MTNTKNMKKVLLGISIILAVLTIGGTIGFYYMAPSSYLALDVNPSIEIHTNRLNQVTSIDPVNEDAKKIMAGYQLTDKNLETVIKNVVDRMILNGFIAPDKDNQILITTGEDQNASKLSKTVNTIVETYLTEKQVDANLIPQSINITSQSIEEAHKNHVSAGKMAIVQKLIDNDSTLTVDQLSKERISDLVALAVSKNISLDGIVYRHTTLNPSANMAIPSGTNKDVQAGNQAANNMIIEDNKDNDKEDQKDDQSTNIKKVNSSKHDDTKDEKQKEKKEDKKDRNSYQKYNENKDQSDRYIEDQGDNDDQEDSDVNNQNEDQNDSDKKVHHDYQKIEYNEDQNDNENENDKEEYEYKQSDNENNNQEDIQNVSDQKDHSDSQYSDHESAGYDD